jgi:hypothetical protein
MKSHRNYHEIQEPPSDPLPRDAEGKTLTGVDLAAHLEDALRRIRARQTAEEQLAERRWSQR